MAECPEYHALPAVLVATPEALRAVTTVLEPIPGPGTHAPQWRRAVYVRVIDRWDQDRGAGNGEAGDHSWPVSGVPSGRWNFCRIETGCLETLRGQIDEYEL